MANGYNMAQTYAKTTDTKHDKHDNNLNNNGTTCNTVKQLLLRSENAQPAVNCQPNYCWENS